MDFLCYALNTAYVGRDHLAGSIFSDAVKRLESVRGAMGAAELRDQIDEVLLQIPDSHLQASLNGRTSAKRRASLPLGSVGPNAISKPKKAWEVRREHWRKQAYLYLSITRFPVEHDPLWRDFISSVKAGLKGANFLVLDLRGNGGGDDSMGYALAKLLFGNDLDDPVYRHYFSRTSESLVIQGNSLRLERSLARREGRSLNASLDEKIEDNIKRYEASLTAHSSPELVRFQGWRNHAFDPKRGFDKDIYILQDRACALSCEATINAFETNPHAKRVGEPTAGDVHFGALGLVRLPASTVLVQMATAYHEFYDGRFIEREGIKPDLFVPRGQDALKYLLQELPLAL